MIITQRGGFACEPEDASVGIFGDFWWHDLCEVVPFNSDFFDTPEAVLVTEKIPDTDTYVYTLSCPACGYAYSWEEVGW